MPKRPKWAPASTRGAKKLSGVRAFLHDPYAKFCGMTIGTTLLGELMTRSGSAQRDIRFVSGVAAPQIVRPYHRCNASDQYAGPPIPLTARTLRAIPPGPWDERRNALCSAARAGRETDLCVVGAPGDHVTLPRALPKTG